MATIILPPACNVVLASGYLNRTHLVHDVGRPPVFVTPRYVQGKGTPEDALTLVVMSATRRATAVGPRQLMLTFVAPTATASPGVPLAVLQALQPLGSVPNSATPFGAPPVYATGPVQSSIT